MHPSPFNDDLQESGIPYFGKNGTALSQEERASIARRRGLCLKCGTRTHVVKIMSRTPLTNDDVYQGICIKCNNNSVPASVLQEWQMRNAQVAAVKPVNNRFKAVGNAVRVTHGSHPGLRPPNPAAGLAAMTQSLPSRPPDGYNRASSNSTSNSNSDTHTSSSRSLNHTRSTGMLPAASISGSASSGENYKASGSESLSPLKTIKENKERSEIIKTKLHALRNQVGPEEPGTLHEIKDLMEKYQHDPRMIMVSAGALWGIVSKSEDKKDEALAEGCIDQLLDTVRNGVSRDDPEAVQWILGALASLASYGGNRKAITEAKGIEAILEIMKRHERVPCVFEWGCRVLFSLIGGYEGDGDAASFERQISIIENYGGIRVIVETIKLHLSESTPILWALKVLLRMQDREDPNGVARSVQLMNDDDLSVPCIRIINAKVSPDVVLHSQVMLLYLMSHSSNETMQQQAVECIPSVFRAMTENPNQPDLVEVSAEFLTEVSRNDFRAKRKIADNSGPRIVIGCMSSYSDNLSVQRALVSLLWLMSSDESSFDYSILADAKQALEKSAKVHSRDGEIGQAICGFVANTIARAHGQRDCVPLDLVIQLATAGSAGTQGGRILAAACAAFPDVTNQITQGGMFERLLEGLREGKSEVQMASADALAAIMIVSDAVRSKVYASGGLALVTTSLNAANSEPLIQSLLKFTNALVAGGSKKALQLPNDIIHVLLQTTKTHPTVTKLTCTTIRNLMLVTVPGFMVINTDGLVEFLIEVLGNPSNSDDVVIEACGALWACLSKQPNSNTNLLSQCFRAVLGLCVRHKGESTAFNSPILTEAAGALSSVMYCIRENPFYISDEDIDSIISILDIVIECDVQNFSLMERLMDAIFSLCFLSKEILIQFGVIVVVIDCMVEHESNEVIQQLGCAILALLASTENLQVNLSIAETDGIDMIVSALAGFTENLVIQTDACRALSHLSIDHESRMLISSQGGLILLVNAMNRFRDEVDLLEAACSALLNLSSDAEEQVLSGSSVVETVVSTMRHQVNSPRLQEKCLGVLQNISMRSKNAKQEIANAGGIGAVIFAIKEFMGSPSVLERSFTTMWSLAVLEGNQRRIALEGGISLVVNGMMANIEYEKVQKQACGCLCTLSTDSENKTLIRDLGGVDAIVYAMWAHYSADALLIEACRALSSLAVNVQTNEVMIASEGEIGAIMSAMRRFPDSERLQEHACVAIRNFLLSSDNVAIVRPHATELDKLMNTAATKFPERCSERAKQVRASLNAS